MKSTQHEQISFVCPAEEHCVFSFVLISLHFTNSHVNCIYVIHQDFYFLSRVLPPCPLWDSGAFISSTQKICINLLLKKHHEKGHSFTSTMTNILQSWAWGSAPYSKYLPRAVLITFNVTSIQVLHTGFLQEGNFHYFCTIHVCLHQIFLQDSVCINNWNSCMGVEYVCPVFYPFCTKYVIRGKSLSFPINCCKSSLKTKFVLPRAAHYHYQHHKLPSCLHHSNEYLSHWHENRLQSHPTCCIFRNYVLVTAQVLSSLRPPYFKRKRC